MNKHLILSFLLCFSLSIYAEKVDDVPLAPTKVVRLYDQAPAESNGYTDQDEWVKDGHKIYQIATPRIELYYPADTRKPMPVLLTIPGGAYAYVSSGNEGGDVAKYLCQRGIVVAVLQYRLPNGHENIPLSDACRAMEMLRDSAAAWNLIADKIGVMGFSAGGHLAGSLVTKYSSEKARPDYGILIYPVISTDSTMWHRGSFRQLVGEHATAEQYAAWSLDQQVHSAMPPCLLAACTDDKTVPVDNTLLMYQAMRAQHVPAQLLILPTGGHGWGFRRDFERRDLVDNAIVQYIWANVGDKKKEQLYQIVKKEVRANDGKKDWPQYNRYQAKNDSIIANHIAVKAVFMGNSITDHWGRWRPEFFAKYHCAARGISAQTTYEMLARMQADVVDLHPEMVFILAGANDLACNRGVISEEHIIGNIRSMCDIAVAHGIRPMICSLLPHRAFLWNTPLGNPVPRIDRINVQLKAYAEANGFGWIDYNSAMRALDGGMREGLSPDEVHPYKEAYQIMEDIVKPYLKK